VATSGRSLLEAGAQRSLERELFPLARLITPNISEAEILAGTKIRDPEDMRAAALKLYDRFGCAVLLKGGHLPRMREALDLFYDRGIELLFTAPYFGGIKLHGTGCTYSAAITGFLALKHPIQRAIARAKEFITGAIVNRWSVAGHPVLGMGRRED
jgi:hydroxymethylpyrimidine/phosphomethylpyrimidine kinase